MNDVFKGKLSGLSRNLKRLTEVTNVRVTNVSVEINNRLLTQVVEK